MNREKIEDFAGTPIGEKGDSIAPFLGDLKVKSLPVPSEGWVYQMRNGLTKGGRFLYSLHVAAASDGNSSNSQ